MAERKGIFPITGDMLEKHEAELLGKMSSVRARSTGRSNLTELLKGLRIDREWTEAEDAFRRGFCLYYEMYDTLQRRISIEKIDGEIPESEKRVFLSAYSAFAASSFIENRLNKQVKGEIMEFPRPKGPSFDFSQTQNDVLDEFLARIYRITELRKNEGGVKTGQDLVNSSVDIFKYIKEEAVSKKPELNKKLVDLVSGTEFRIMDEFTLLGFEETLEEKFAVSGPDYIPVQPHEISGNVLAKKEMLRDMDRVSLFDPILKKNPVSEVGGLSWSVLYHGFPGTGKTTLFSGGRTRLDKRCVEVSEFWKTKNFPRLSSKVIIIDPRVKSKFYGETGERVAAACDEMGKPDTINIGIIDDIDLLFSGDRDDSSGGADKDIMNVLMQALSGANLTVRMRGNAQWWSATNAAASIEPALLQRFSAKYEVEGPQEWYDYADILSTKLGTWIKRGIVEIPAGKGYTPFEMRKGQTGYENIGSDSLSALQGKKSKGGTTLRDIGELCLEKKKINPKFTGRPIDAIAEAVKKRINDYDIPEEWYTNSNIFLAKDYEQKVGMLTDLCKKVNGDIIAQEIERYARTEEKYASDKFDKDVGKSVYNAKVQMATLKRLKSEGASE